MLAAEAADAARTLTGLNLLLAATPRPDANVEHLCAAMNGERPDPRASSDSDAGTTPARKDRGAKRSAPLAVTREPAAKRAAGHRARDVVKLGVELSADGESPPRDEAASIVDTPAAPSEAPSVPDAATGTAASKATAAATAAATSPHARARSRRSTTARRGAVDDANTAAASASARPTPAELRRMAEQSRLDELKRTNPKRAERILKNRESASRSRERRARLTRELEGETAALRADNVELRERVASLEAALAAARAAPPAANAAFPASQSAPVPMPPPHALTLPPFAMPPIMMGMPPSAHAAYAAALAAAMGAPSPPAATVPDAAAAAAAACAGVASEAAAPAAVAVPPRS